MNKCYTDTVIKISHISTEIKKLLKDGLSIGENDECEESKKTNKDILLHEYEKG